MDRMEEITLKYCPFCGGPAGFGTIKYDAKTVKYQNWNQDTFHTVSCIYCGASTQRITGSRTQALAAEAWNRRTMVARSEAELNAELFTDGSL